MKKLLFILPAFFFTFAVNAQGTQTEDEVFVGKGKIFGNYKGTGIIIPDYNKTAKKPMTDQTIVTGVVVSGGLVSRMDSLTDKSISLYSFNLKKTDGTVVTIGTRDNGFTVPKEIVGKTITVEGIDLVSFPRRRKDVNINYQKEIQFAATGIKIMD